MSYRDDVARWQRHANARAQRQINNANERWGELQGEYHEVMEEADNAQRNDDRETLNYCYDRMTELEAEMAPYEQAYRQQQQSQPHPAVTQWDARNKQYIERLEQRLGPQGAAQTFAMADGYVTRPKVKDENNWQRTGMGIPRNSPAYFKAMEDMLEQYSGEATGVPYDPKTQMLNANEAAEISGVSPQEYNRQAQLAWQQGKIGNGR